MTKKKKPTYRQLQESLRLVREEAKHYLESLARERDHMRRLTQGIDRLAGENRTLRQDASNLGVHVGTLLCALHNSQVQVEGLLQNNWTVQTPVNEEAR